MAKINVKDLAICDDEERVKRFAYENFKVDKDRWIEKQDGELRYWYTQQYSTELRVYEIIEARFNQAL